MLNLAPARRRSWGLPERVGLLRLSSTFGVVVQTGIVYALTCPHGKKYVGKTSRTLMERMHKHKEHLPTLELALASLLGQGNAPQP